MRDQLSIRIKQGDEQAFELLFRLYYIHLSQYANKFLNDPEQAKEISQEVFCKIWEGRDEIDPEYSLKSYIFRIARNLCINILNKRKLESKYSELIKHVYIDFTDTNSTHESLCAKELEESITAAVSKMPSECRKIFELSRVEGLKYKEIAEMLNISIKTIECQMSKAFRILREELNEYLLPVFLLALSNIFFLQLI